MRFLAGGPRVDVSVVHNEVQHRLIKQQIGLCVMKTRQAKATIVYITFGGCHLQEFEGRDSKSEAFLIPYQGENAEGCQIQYSVYLMYHRVVFRRQNPCQGSSLMLFWVRMFSQNFTCLSQSRVTSPDLEPF